MVRPHLYYATVPFLDTVGGGREEIAGAGTVEKGVDRSAHKVPMGFERKSRGIAGRKNEEEEKLQGRGKVSAPVVLFQRADRRKPAKTTCRSDR